MAFKLNLTKGNLGGLALSLLSTLYYLDQTVGKNWLEGGFYSNLAAAITLLTGVTLTAVSVKRAS